MFNKVRTIGKIVKTVASPITQAANVIKTTFTKPKTDQASKYRKKALKMTKEATAKAGESAKAAESRIGKEEAQKIGRETKSKMVKDFLRYNRDLKAKGGRIGFKGGSGRSGVPAMDIKSTPTKKLSEKQKKIAKLAGDPRRIDKPDFKVLQSRRKNKKII